MHKVEHFLTFRHSIAFNGPLSSTFFNSMSQNHALFSIPQNFAFSKCSVNALRSHLQLFGRNFVGDIVISIGICTVRSFVWKTLKYIPTMLDILFLWNFTKLMLITAPLQLINSLTNRKSLCLRALVTLITPQEFHHTSLSRHLNYPEDISCVSVWKLCESFFFILHM